MFRGRWRYLVAATGLTAVCLLGQAQEGQEQPDWTPDEQETSANQFPVPLPIVVIESKEATEASKRAEQESHDREESDLAAQEGMHTHTKRMADYAVAQTFLIFVGTGALIWTLWETRKMTSATRDIGQKQVRAYLAGRESKFAVSAEGMFFVFLNIENVGQSPATVTSIKYEIIPQYIGGKFYDKAYVDSTRPRRLVAAGSSETFNGSRDIEGFEPEDFDGETFTVSVNVTVEWVDVFDKTDSASFHCSNLNPNKYFGEHSDNILAGVLQVYGQPETGSNA